MCETFDPYNSRSENVACESAMKKYKKIRIEGRKRGKEVQI